MTSRSVESVRLVIAGAAIFLVAALPAAPASAAPTEPPHAAVSIAARVLYPPGDSTPGPPGTSKDAPAHAGPTPGLLRVRVEVTNVGTEPLGEFIFYDHQVTNGIQDGFQCDLDSSDPWINDPDFALDPGRSITCTETYSEIKQGTLYESIRSVAAFAPSTQEWAEATAHVWAEAGPAAPPSPPPPPVSVGHLVWIDTNHNKQQDEGEPGIPGLHISLRLALGEPRPDGDFIAEETTTDKNGIYHFNNVKPGVRYAVILDTDAPGLLKDLVMWSYPFNYSAGSADTSRSPYSYDAMNFGFKPKDRLSISIDAPTTAAVGTTIDVKGHQSLPGRPTPPGDYWVFQMVLEFRAGGTTTWTKVAVADDCHCNGDSHVQVKVTRSGWFRYRSPGDGNTTTSGVSREAHVLVSTTPVALTATAPTAVRQGSALTVTGTITRAGIPFKTGRITLEYTPDATTWTTIANVRSADGTLTATVQPARTGSYRYHYAGDSSTAPGTSAAQHVTVNPEITKSPSPSPHITTSPSPSPHITTSPSPSPR